MSNATHHVYCDGVVDWRFGINGDPANDAEVIGTHVGLAFNPFAYQLIARRLVKVPAPA